MQRFRDQDLRLSHFENEVLVVCPKCKKRAKASANYEEGKARLLCMHCGMNKTRTTETIAFGIQGAWKLAAHQYFGVSLWLIHPFKQEFVWAYNEEHLEYLRQYIAADLREHQERTHFTLLEKLPKFYHDAKNRSALLKVIAKMKAKK